MEAQSPFALTSPPALFSLWPLQMCLTALLQQQSLTSKWETGADRDINILFKKYNKLTFQETQSPNCDLDSSGHQDYLVYHPSLHSGYALWAVVFFSLHGWKDVPCCCTPTGMVQFSISLWKITLLISLKNTVSLLNTM